MARTAIPVDRTALTDAINTVEKDGPLPNLGMLWRMVAEHYNIRATEPISFSVVALRVKEWSIPTLTQPGKRGVSSGAHKQAMQAGRGTRKPRAEKMKEHAETFSDLRLITPSRFLPVIEAAEKGSLRAAIKLKCLDCCCYQTQEIKTCGITECSLYPHRPYKSLKNTESDLPF